VQDFQLLLYKEGRESALFIWENVKYEFLAFPAGGYFFGPKKVTKKGPGGTIRL
jgi:hypothetical protein